MKKVTDWHTKPPPKIRSVDDSMASAERKRHDLQFTVQVHAWDWDEVILADEVKRLRKSMNDCERK